MNILITGCAGFIGFHTAKRFIENGYNVIGVDNLNDYYDVQLKKDRLKNINSELFKFYKFDLNQKEELKDLFYSHKIDYVINLAAQAGVRYSQQILRNICTQIYSISQYPRAMQGF